LWYCDKKIKRYFDKKIFFNKYFFSPCKLKILIFSMYSWVCIDNYNILKCHYNILKNKLSFYCNIFLSQCCVQKCLVWIRPNNELNQPNHNNLLLKTSVSYNRDRNFWERITLKQHKYYWKAHITRKIFPHNIAIKRYCD